MIIVHMSETAWMAHENGRGILIDTGRKTDGGGIIKRVSTMGVSVPFIFLTHTHYDHTGGVEAIRQATGATVIVGAEEADALRKGFTPVPAGTGRLGRFLSRAAHTLGSKSHEHYSPVPGEKIRIGEPGVLECLGKDIEAYHLGAHTVGSIGLRIGDDFFAGDTVFNIGGVIYPPFADRPDEIPAAWATIIGSGAKKIYPGHGGPFTVRVLEKKYKSVFEKKKKGI